MEIPSHFKFLNQIEWFFSLILRHCAVFLFFLFKKVLSVKELSAYPGSRIGGSLPESMTNVQVSQALTVNGLRFQKSYKRETLKCLIQRQPKLLSSEGEILMWLIISIEWGASTLFMEWDAMAGMFPEPKCGDTKSLGLIPEIYNHISHSFMRYRIIF